MDTCSLPNKGRSLSSALMLRRLAGSCKSCFLMYSQIFLVTSVRGSGSAPMMAARVGLGVSGFMKAALGLRAVFADVAIGECSNRGRKSRFPEHNFSCGQRQSELCRTLKIWRMDGTE